MDTPNPRYLEERSRVLVGNLPDDFLRFNEENQNPGLITNGHSQNPSQVSQQQQHQHMAPQPMVNQITITIVQAELTKSYSLTKMDPYVRVRIGHSVYETHTSIRGGKFPRWNKIISSYLDPGIKTIHFEMFDECTLTPDERIAYADLVIPDDVFQGKLFDENIPLSGKQGTDKEGFLSITMHIKSVPYWSTVSAPTLMITPDLPYYTRQYGNPMLGLPRIQTVQYQQPHVQYQQPHVQYQQPHVQYQQPPMVNPNYAYPAVQPQPYRPSEEEIKQMQEMFPAYDQEVILSVLENCHGNKDQAITSLLSLADK